MRVNRAELLQRLEAVEPGLSLKDIVEQSSSYIFENGRVMTFNEEVACSTSSPIPKEFTGAVRARPLKNLLAKLVEDDVDIEAEKGEFIITGKRRRAGIKMDEKVTLDLSIVEAPKKEDWFPLADDFADAVGMVQECAGNDEDKFITTCIHITPKWLEAFDNYQLSRYKVKMPIKESTIVKKDNIKHLMTLDMTEVSETPKWLHFRNPAGLRFSCKRLMEQFPDLTALLDQVKDTYPVTLPPGLADAADKAEVFSKEEKANNLVTVELRQGKIRITGTGSFGWYQEVKSCVYEGKTLSFMVPPTLLKDIIKRHNDCEITRDWLLVRGGKFLYMTSVGTPDANGHGVE
jgi:DNA polymerase III sliding clamp (beta) subunit (PCNA family)